MKSWMKWILVISSYFVILLLCGVNVQAENYNISTNDSWISGSTGVEDINYYHFTIPSAGRVTVTFQSYRSYGFSDLWDKDLVKCYYNMGTISGSDTSPATKQYSVDLEAGTYSLKTASGYSTAGNYRVKVSFVAANNNEREPNNAFTTAMPLSSGVLVTGFLSEDDSIDFYKFTIPAGATVRTTVSTTMGYYYFSVWNSDFIEVDSYNSSSQTRVWEKYLEAGTYYIKINRDGARTGVYTLKWTGYQYVRAISLKSGTKALTKGKTYNLLKAVTPSTATDKSLQWTSSDTSVAKVNSNGKVSAVGIGTATIKASTMDGSELSASCVIIVKPKKTTVKSCKLVKNRNVTMKVKKQKNVSGIQYQLSKKKNFKGKKSSYYAGSTEAKATTAPLSQNKTYYFRARMYVDYNGKRYYGAWSNVKSVKTKNSNTIYGYYHSWKDV